jgi:hypothetical protein
MEKLTDSDDDDDGDDGDDVWNGTGHQERRAVLCVVVETLEGGLVKAWTSPTRKLAANKADQAD